MAEILKIPATERLRVCRREFTLDLFTRYGMFWDAIKQLRERWGISALVELPPRAAPWLYFPSTVPEAASPPPKDDDAYLDPAVWSNEANRWLDEITALHNHVVPPSCRLGLSQHQSRSYWLQFLAACALYHPPETKLLAYAESAFPPPRPFLPHDVLFPDEADIDAAPRAIGAPIRYMRDGEEVSAAYVWYVGRLLSELDHRLGPSGVNVSVMVKAIRQETKLDNELRERLRGVVPQLVIPITSETTQADVVSAYQAISAWQPPSRRRPGHPPRDRLMAVQCAILQQLGWTEPEIATKFGWPLSSDSYGNPRRSTKARNFIKDGKKILAERNYSLQ